MIPQSTLKPQTCFALFCSFRARVGYFDAPGGFLYTEDQKLAAAAVGGKRGSELFTARTFNNTSPSVVDMKQILGKLKTRFKQ